ncbi:unnamed protein product [Protopolystoma xenopodis]|uniref:Uncharacterized protein n=1 Tax=Protopolystoma xenopodis TaxID=117903 RepID=A0A448WN88_9PLAT|nr:unnamed protein product [Protopolystoma xenopodis]
MSVVPFVKYCTTASTAQRSSKVNDAMGGGGGGGGTRMRTGSEHKARTHSLHLPTDRLGLTPSANCSTHPPVRSSGFLCFQHTKNKEIGFRVNVDMLGLLLLRPDNGLLFSPSRLVNNLPFARNHPNISPFAYSFSCRYHRQMPPSVPSVHRRPVSRASPLCYLFCLARRASTPSEDDLNGTDSDQGPSRPEQFAGDELPEVTAEAMERPNWENREHWQMSLPHRFVWARAKLP